MPARVEIVIGRIEQLRVDAVVNAANRALAPGTGVDGALRAAAGPALTRLTDTMAPINVGDAVLTPGFNARARYIIHTAAPIWLATGAEEDKRAGLARCYANTLALAEARKLRTLALPCLGTGNFGWPREAACAIAIDTCLGALAGAKHLRTLTFCCFTEADGELYRARLG